MLWLVIGGIGCGKSAFADELALAVGREGIRLSCPSFPLGEPPIVPGETGESRFYKTRSEADETLPGKINAINLESNFFRAERRVVVVDSLSGWLRASFARSAGREVNGAEPGRGTEIDGAGIEAVRWRETIDAILAFEGRIIVVTEEPAAGLNPSPGELEYARRLAEANRELLQASRSVYRMTAGMAMELKGYRMKERSSRNENIHADR
jgi:adenosylcobinamide kinase/adenosylcobinamide-phosphate guanylyltransferase